FTRWALRTSLPLLLLRFRPADPDDADSVPELDRRAERRGELHEVVDDLLAELRRRQHRPAAPRPRLLVAERNRVELQLRELFAVEPRHRDHRLPDARVGREADGVVVRPPVVEVADAGA